MRFIKNLFNVSEMSLIRGCVIIDFELPVFNACKNPDQSDDCTISDFCSNVDSGGCWWSDICGVDKSDCAFTDVCIGQDLSDCLGSTVQDHCVSMDDENANCVKIDYQ